MKCMWVLILFDSEVYESLAKLTSNSKRSTNRNNYFLSQEERDFYAENGYLVIRGLFDQHTLNAFRDRFRAFCSNETLALSCSIIRDKNLVSTKPNPEDFVYKIQDILNDPVFKLYSEDPRLLHIASQFLGDQLTALNCMLINKPPHSTIHPSHQDGYYFPIRPLNIIAAWTAIDAATVDNGCLYVVPGSHRLDLMPHGNFEDSKKFFHLVADEALVAPKENKVYLEMGPGDTVFFHPHLLHGSGPNNTKMHRKAMTVHYMDSSCRYIDLVGTPQEQLLTDFKEKVQRNGMPDSYQTLWQLKSKKLQPRSRL